MRTATIQFRGEPVELKIETCPDDGVTEYVNVQPAPALGITYGGGEPIYSVRDGGPGIMFVSRDRLGIILGRLADEHALAMRPVTDTLKCADKCASCGGWLDDCDGADGYGCARRAQA